MGLDVSRKGALIARDGAISESLLTVGPARKGDLWESTAVPEIREQVHRLVEHLVSASRFARSRAVNPYCFSACGDLNRVKGVDAGPCS